MSVKKAIIIQTQNITGPTQQILVQITVEYFPWN